MTRVIYLSILPLTAKLTRDWFIDHLRNSSDVDVEYWDLTPLLRGEIKEHHMTSADYIKVIRSHYELEQAISDRKNSCFVVLLPKIWKFRAIFRLLTRNQCKTVVVMWGAMPAPSAASKAGILRWLSNPITFFSKIRNRLYGLILTSSFYIKPFDLAFTAGRTMQQRSKTERKTVPIALCDFEQYAQSLSCERLVEKNYAIFLDVYLPFHSDLALVGMNPLDPDKYYSSLDGLFSQIERSFGLEVVIAAHPKAQYSNDEYKGRRVISENTATLVRYAELVICHASTSVCYAVQNRKPVWSVYTEQMAVLYSESYMLQLEALASYLQIPLLNADRFYESELPELAPPNEVRYSAYVEDFIVTDGIKGGQSKEIFLREIRSLGE